MKTIYAQLAAIGRPQIIGYLTDLTVHDRALCRSLVTGDTFAWQCNPNGTHFARIKRMACSIDAAPGQMRLDAVYFDAVAGCYPDRQWWMCTSTDGQYGTVRRACVPQIKAHYEILIRRATNIAADARLEAARLLTAA